MIKNATLSSCGAYRYFLGRNWGDSPCVNFIMLNPSTADHEKDDATIRKCIGFAKRWGFGSLVVSNLYAYRATKPKDLKLANKNGIDIVGLNNDRIVYDLAKTSDLVVFACGNNVLDRQRLDEVFRKLLEYEGGLEIKCFPLTKKGFPPHPLMLAYDTELVPYPEY